MRELRRKDRAIPHKEAMAILQQAEYGVLSTVSADGMPYGVPLSFCLSDGCIYFHCALEGQKIDNIKQNALVSFCTVGKTEILPDKFGTMYESVIVTGEAEEVFDQDKQEALEALLRKYSAGFLEQGAKYIEAMKEKTRVFRLIISNVSGKARIQ